MKKPIIAVAIAAAAAGCANTNTVRTSADTAIVSAAAAPVCGRIGAAQVAQRQAAIETLKAGFDRYIIVGAQNSSDVRVSQMPGTYQTTGTVFGNSVYATTTYQPGAAIVSGSYNQDFAIKMFKDGQPGASQALSARAALGPKWQDAVKRGAVSTCGADEPTGGPAPSGLPGRRGAGGMDSGS